MEKTSADVASVAASIAADAPDPTTTGLPSLTGASQDDTAGGLKEPSNGNDSSEFDSAGVRWDAAIHSPGKAKKLDGTWRAKKGATGKAALALPAGPTPPPGPPPHMTDAVALHNTITGLAVMFMGPEWKPSDQEAGGMIEATRTTLEAYGGFAMPPWAAMVIAYGVYAASRFHLPTTKARVDSLGGKASRWWAGIKAPFARKAQSPKLTPSKTSLEQPGGTVEQVSRPLPPGAEIGFDPSARTV